MKILAVFSFFILFSIGCTTHSPRNFELETIAPPLVMKKSLKVASVQFPIQGDLSEEAFLKKMEQHFAKAAKNKAELLVFPELITLDLWPKKSKQTDKDIVLQIAKFSPTYLKAMQDFATKHKIDVVAGSVPVVENVKLYNRAYFVSKKGDVQFQDKIMLTPWGKKVGFATGTRIHPFITDWGFFVLLICYDVESPSISNHLTKFNIELPLIVVPSMTESEEGLRRVQYTAKARAVEHHTYVAVASTVGTPSKDWPNIGQAVFFNPQAPGYSALLAMGHKNKAEIVYQTLDLDKLRQSQSQREFYPAAEPTPFQ